MALLSLINLVLGAGFTAALTGRLRAAAVWLAVIALVIAARAVTVWMVPMMFVVLGASIVDSYLHIRRRRQQSLQQVPGAIRWNWWAPLVAVAAYATILLGARVFVVEAFRVPSSGMAPTLMPGDTLDISKLVATGRGDIIVFQNPCKPNYDFVERIVALASDRVEVRCGALWVNGVALEAQLVANDSYIEQDGSQGSRRVAVHRYRETIDGHAFDVFRSEPNGVVSDFPQRAVAPSCATAEFDFRPDPGARDQSPGEIVDTDPATRDKCAPQRHYVVPAGHVFVMGDNRDNSNDSRNWGAVPQRLIRGRVTGVWLPLDRFGNRQ